MYIGQTFIITAAEATKEISFNKKKWISGVNFNKKLVFSKRYTTEEYAARARDLYILLNLNRADYKINFQWTIEDIAKWKQLLKF